MTKYPHHQIFYGSEILQQAVILCGFPDILLNAALGGNYISIFRKYDGLRVIECTTDNQ